MTASAEVSASWHEIADRVFVRRYELLDQTIPVVLGDDVALVVDTRSAPAHARELLAAIRTLAPRLRPIDDGGLIVVNSHHHWDHTFGNAAVRPATIWGHVRCPLRMRERWLEARERVAAGLPELADDLAEVTCDPPDRTFDTAQELDVGGRRVEMRYLGRGHTDDDIVLLVPDVGVVLAGDLVEEGAPPSFSDSFPLDWPATLAGVLDLIDHVGGAGAIVPGHGDVVGREFVEAELADIAVLAQAARRTFAEDGGLEQALELGIVPYSKPVAREALGRAFAQLRGELGE